LPSSLPTGMLMDTLQVRLLPLLSPRATPQKATPTPSMFILPPDSSQCRLAIPSRYSAALTPHAYRCLSFATRSSSQPATPLPWARRPNMRFVTAPPTSRLLRGRAGMSTTPASRSPPPSTRRFPFQRTRPSSLVTCAGCRPASAFSTRQIPHYVLSSTKLC